MMAIELVPMVDHRDGSAISEGERIRYRQVPGGLLPASQDWTYGVAARYARPVWDVGVIDNPAQLYLLGDNGRYYGAAWHIVERVSE